MPTHAMGRLSIITCVAAMVATGCSRNDPATGEDTPNDPTANVAVASGVATPEPVSFSRDIRPILSDKCFLCHGPDERMREETGGLRLDLREEAIAFGAFVPGDADDSALVHRVTSRRATTIMPPPDSNLSLTDDEIELLSRWIAEGAEYTDHWAFVPPTRPEPPAAGESWARNDIDHFIHARLDREAITPNPEADKATLLRRVTLSLTGLPPTPQELDTFLADTSDDAYERAVDRLLDSPRFGEHQSRYWLDAVRYADTHGYHLDNERSVWPYRDWVIDALNDNLPFNTFIEHQLGGDLYEEPTTKQLVASGFVRMNPTTGEGGAIDEEYIVKYAIDRVDTFSTVFLGMTVGCAQCHDHKYDPVSQRDYYQLFAYFNSTAEAAMDGNALAPAPSIRVLTDEQQAQIASLQTEVQAIEDAIAQQLAAIDYEEPAGLTAIAAPTQPTPVIWIEDDTPPGAAIQGNGQAPHWRWITAPDHPVHSGARSTHRQAPGLSQHFFTGAADPLVIHEGDTLFAWVYLDPDNPPQVVQLQFNNGDWNHRARWGANKAHAPQASGAANYEAGELPATGEWVKLSIAASAVGLNPGDRLNGWAFTQFGGSVYYDHAGIETMHPPDDRYKVSRSVWETLAADDAGVPQPIRTLIALPLADRTPAQDREVLDYYLRYAHEQTRAALAPLEQERQQLLAQADQIETMAPFTFIAKELDTPRPVYVLNRGEYDQPINSITRQLRPLPFTYPEPIPALTRQPPKALNTHPPVGEHNNRLGLAHWLTDPNHPLTARVAVNRIWQQYFGTGIVQTSEDFGSQGDWPSHPALLDWLAVEFVESGWDVKHIHRLIVTSAAYRQSSQVSPDLLERDPNNRLLARGPRFRLDAEVVRDQALFISGLLVETVGGPSVRPYQPDGLWKVVGYTSSNTANFTRGSGDDLYRRSMYTFWKRTSPPPAMSMFDAPSRESCSVRRSRTNTPLQALVTLNDIQFVEAARVFAQRILEQHPSNTDAQLTYAFALATSRPPTDTELAVLRSIYHDQRAVYEADPAAAAALIAMGEFPTLDSLAATDLAAMTIVANTLLNLDEVLTQH